ncbi:MAG: hypothetical protein V1809_12825 [Planctomycetota bacterium]
MPEDLDHPSFPADQPPDPAAAKAAAREARRMLAVSRWPLFLMMGLWSFALAAIVLTYRRNEMVGDLLSGGWALSLLVPALAWPAIGRRFQAKLGAFALHRGEKGWREPISRGTVIGMACGLVVALLLVAVAVLLPKDKGPWVGLVVLVSLGLVVGIPMAGWGIGIRLLEYVLLGLMIVAMPALYLLGRSSRWHEPPWSMVICFSLVLTAAGTSLALRWRRWVRSLPREESGDREVKS